MNEVAQDNVTALVLLTKHPDQTKAMFEAIGLQHKYLGRSSSESSKLVDHLVHAKEINVDVMRMLYNGKIESVWF